MEVGVRGLRVGLGLTDKWVWVDGIRVSADPRGKGPQGLEQESRRVCDRPERARTV